MWTCKNHFYCGDPTFWSGPQHLSSRDNSALQLNIQHLNVVNLEPHVQKCGFNDVPRVHQRHIVEMAEIPLRALAQLACLCKDMHALYLERVQERDAHVANLLVSCFEADFRDGLTPAQTALPRDLIVDFRVRLHALLCLLPLYVE
jgi:hypothetical protein